MSNLCFSCLAPISSPLMLKTSFVGVPPPFLPETKKFQEQFFFWTSAQFLMISTFVLPVESKAIIFIGTNPFKHSSMRARVSQAFCFFSPDMEPELSRRISMHPEKEPSFAIFLYTSRSPLTNLESWRGSKNPAFWFLLTGFMRDLKYCSYCLRTIAHSCFSKLGSSAFNSYWRRYSLKLVQILFNVVSGITSEASVLSSTTFTAFCAFSTAVSVAIVDSVTIAAAAAAARIASVIISVQSSASHWTSCPLDPLCIP